MRPADLATGARHGHRLLWAAPRPLWRSEAGSRAPALLRFASDDFMDRLIHLLESDPARLAELAARPESWRDAPAPGPAGPLPDPLNDPARLVPLPTMLRANRRQRLGAAAVPVAPAANDARPLKLWQPAHQRYYLVAASLACALPGLPEHRLAGPQERTGFVLRRLFTAGGTAREHAYIAGEGKWQPVDDGLAPGEELLPLFPLRHHDAASGGSRTILAGLVPVARREAYLASAVASAPVSLSEGQAAALNPAPTPPPAPSVMARLTDLRLRVIEPWKAMVASAAKAAAAIAEVPEDRATRAYAANLDFQMQSWLLLADLRAWIARHLPALEAAIARNIRPPAGSDARTLHNWMIANVRSASLQLAMRDPGAGDAEHKPMAANLLAALAALAPGSAAVAALEAAATHYTPAVARDPAARANWPGLHFPLAGVSRTGAAIGPWQVAPAPGGSAAPLPDGAAVAAAFSPPGTPPDEAALISDPAEAGAALDTLAALFGRALTPQVAETAPPLPHAMLLRDRLVKTAGDPGWFIIRMVHLNAECGPLHPPTLSEATGRFQLGSFFDPDAPVRPVTITLPADTSPAGLRRHGRGTAFVMSDMLCGQVQRAKGLGLVDLIRHVLPFPLHKELNVGDGGGCKGGGADIGMICSLSIPIITLVALILLMIMVSLLDFIFRWLPWFIACFPVPKLKGKP